MGTRLVGELDRSGDKLLAGRSRNATALISLGASVGSLYT
jgi:hypothetical protein